MTSKSNLTIKNLKIKVEFTPHTRKFIYTTTTTTNMIVHYKERKATKSYAILFLAVKLTTAEKTSCVLVSGYNIHTSIIEYSQLCNSSTPFKPLNDGILDYARALPDYDLRIVYVPKVHHTPKKAAELKKEYNIILEPYSRGDTDI